MKSLNNLQTDARNVAADAAAMIAPRWWGFVLASTLLAAGVAELVYLKLDLPQRYAEFVVGAIAWTYENKFRDFALLYGFVAAFLVALAVLTMLAARLKSLFGFEGVDRLHDGVLLLCAPAGLWLGELITTKSSSLWLLHASQGLLVAGLLMAAVLVGRGKAFWQERSEDLFRTLSTLLLFVVLSALAISAIGVAVNRLGARVHAHHWLSSERVLVWTCIAAVAAISIAGFLSAKARDSFLLDESARRLTVFAQAFLPLFFLCLVPPSWVWGAEGSLGSGYRLSALGKTVVLVCMALAYVDLYRRARAQLRHEPNRGSPLELVSIACAVGVLLFLKMTPLGLAIVNHDDYHFGEMLVPWWSWADKGQLPFWDYAPARGLLNYIPGALSKLLFDGSPTTIYAAHAFVFVVFIPIALVVLRASIGMGAAFVAILLGPAVNGYGEIDLVTTTYLAYLCWGYFNWTPQRWLATFAALGTLLLLYTPGQGALTLIACGPIALFKAWELQTQQPRRLLTLALTIALVLTVLCVFTPFGKMILGALRYGAEQSSINSIAHGVNWSASFGTAMTNPWLFEMMRVSWLGVAIASAVLMLKAWPTERGPDRTRVFIYAGAILIILMLFVVRSAGRIDPGGSRLGLAASWALSLLAPLLLFLVTRLRGIHVLAWAALAGLVTPHLGGMALSTLARNFNPVDATDYDSRNSTRLADDPRLGDGIVSNDQMARITVARQVLDAVLDPNETYLDLTTRHAMYFYVDRKPPVESGSMYNLVGQAQQLRAIQSIHATKLPAVLVSGDNVTHDGGPPSLRSNLVYRDVLLWKGYKLATIGRQVWLIRDDRLQRLSSLPGVSIQDVDSSPASPLMSVFHESDLRSIPASWGRSDSTLHKSMVSVLDVPPSMISVVNDADQTAPGVFAVTGKDPFVRFDISTKQLRGDDAGLLSFDFSCVGAPRAEPKLRVFWGSGKSQESMAASFVLDGRQGRLIVPVDSSPAWLLSPHIRTIRVDAETSLDACSQFSIRNLQLLRRQAASAVP